METKNDPSKTPSKAILCLHGGGSSAAIFRFQLAKLRFALKKEFEFIFVNAPNSAIAGPGILPLFADAGPFYGWFDPKTDQPESEIAKVHYTIRNAVDVWESTKTNPNTRIVALLAFSQGTIAAILLLWQQQLGLVPWFPAMHFVVLICGGFTQELAAQMQQDLRRSDEQETVLSLPTLHLHGRRDPFLMNSRKMVMNHFNAEADLLEFDGGHHCPNTRRDIDEATKRILKLSGLTRRKTGN